MGFDIIVVDSITSEDGDTARFRIRLDTQPTSEVSVYFDTTKNDREQDEGLLATGDFNKRFSVDNWDQYQDVVIVGQDDSVIDGDVIYQVIGAALSDDTRYELLHTPNIQLVNLDNDEDGGGGGGGGGGPGTLILEYSVARDGQTVNGTLTFPQVCASAGSNPPGGYHLTGDTGGLITTFNSSIESVSAGSTHTILFTTLGSGIGSPGSGQFNFVENGGVVSGASGIGVITATAGGNGYFGSITGGTYTPMDPIVPCQFLLSPAENPSNEGNSASLTDESLESLVAAANTLWTAVGFQGSFQNPVTFQVADLPGAVLGLATPQAIFVDRDAAGYGWFVDATPFENEEFVSDESTLLALDATFAAGQMDLLTVLAHELGHVLGLEDLDPDDHPDDLLSSTLLPGVRRLPSVNLIDRVFAEGY